MVKEKLFFHGDILTLEERMYEEAILIRDRVILALGSKEKLLEIANEEVELIDLEGKTLMPSFMDAHSHFSGYASSFTQVDLKESSNFKEIKEAILHFIDKNKVPEGKWIQGDGYDHNFLEEKKYPTLEVLDKVAPNNPLVIKHKSGHMGVFNSYALEELGITIETKSPDGGKIEIKDGKLTGYMEEAAFITYIRQLPFLSNEEFIENLEKAQGAYASNGITTVQEGFVVEQLAPIFQFLIQSNILQIDLIGFIFYPIVKTSIRRILYEISEGSIDDNSHNAFRCYGVFQQ